MEFTLGLAMIERPYHVTSVRTSLTRNLSVLFPEVREELAAAFQDAILPTDSKLVIPDLRSQSLNWCFVPIADWVPYVAMEALREIVCRTSNRIFVGAPLCAFFSSYH